MSLVLLFIVNFVQISYCLQLDDSVVAICVKIIVFVSLMYMCVNCVCKTQQQPPVLFCNTGCLQTSLVFLVFLDTLNHLKT